MYKRLIMRLMLFTALLIFQAIGIGIGDTVPESKGNDPSSKGNEGWEFFNMMEIPKGSPVKALWAPLILEGKESNSAKPVTHYLSGTLKSGLKIVLIDADDNKAFDDAGTDVMVLGSSSYGIPFSKILNINNTLYEFKIVSAQKERKAGLKPYEGESTKLDLVSTFTALLPLDLIVVTPGEGIYFDVANNKSFVVPCGSYSLYVGYFLDKGMHVSVKGNKMDKIEVKKESDAPITFKWGPPLKVEFDMSIVEPPPPPEPVKDKTGKTIKPQKPVKEQTQQFKIPYNSLKIFGNANEEYFNFTPQISFSVDVKDANQKVVGTGNFPPPKPGAC